MFAQFPGGKSSLRPVGIGICFTIAATALWFGLGGCASARFYTQAVVGQTTLMLARRDAQSVIEDPRTEPAVADKLRLVATLLDYAERELALPVGERYRTYVELRGPPLWTVVAAPEFDVAAVSRCYPVVGCAVYRGYFSKPAAQREAERLAVDHDVILGAAAAYSTLGWFDDPILSSFLGRDPASLADLIFHELAHSVAYVPGDSAFNESFASFVGSQGAVRWLESQRGDADGYRGRLIAERAFAAFLGRWRERLAALYRQPIADPAKRQLKAAAFDAMRACYEQQKPRLGNGRYDAAMAQPFNNARLALRAAYDGLGPGFARLFDEAGGDWPAFYAAVKRLAQGSRAARSGALTSLGGDATSAPPVDSGPGQCG